MAARILRVKHQGKAFQAGLRIIFWSLVLLLVVTASGIVAALVGTFVAAIAGLLFGLWVLFALSCLFFFRDPNPNVPMEAGVVVSPGSGKVDAIEEFHEEEFMGGRCRRISVFLSILDVHVQRTPTAGRIALLKYNRGEFLNAMKIESGLKNENLLIGIESSERPGERIGVRLIAGMIARRILPWIVLGDEVARGERMSLIRFGSRVDLYLPMEMRVEIQVGTRVQGGATIIARGPADAHETAH